MRRALALAAAVVLAMTLASAPVSATTGKVLHLTASFEYDAWDCGYPMHVAVDSRDTVVVQEHSDGGGVAITSDKFQVMEVWTNADGASFTVERNGLQKDYKPAQVDGSIYRLTHKFSGQTAIVRDSSGRLIYRDRGNLTYSYLLDIATGAFTFLEIDRVAGKYPSLSVEMCKAVAPLVGTDSARYLTPRPIGSTTFPMGFYEYLPPSYRSSGAQSPLLIALNGYGESGDGTSGAISRLLATGIPRFIDIGGWPTDRPLVVLALQHVEEAPVDSGCEGMWYGSCAMFFQDAHHNVPPNSCTAPDEVHDFIAYAVGHYNVDPARVYVTGLSCGGFGTWEYLAKYGNEQVAAAIPIAGEGRPAWATAGCDLASVPIWAFHGELDDVVNPQGSVEPMTNLAGCGVSPDARKLTVYPGLYHDGWDQAYSGSLGDDIYTWMLAFSRP